MIEILTNRNSARLSYVLDQIFNLWLDTPYKLLSSDKEFSTNSVRINYTLEKSSSEAIWIVPNNLIFESGIRELTPALGQWNNKTTLFPSEEGDIPFDIFSAVFYLISRYEEYLPFEGDQHHRFQAKNSLAFREGFLEEPLVDYWLNLFVDKINTRFEFTDNRSFESLITMDVDSAFAYLGKGAYRTIGAGIKDAIKLNFPNLGRRMRTVLRLGEDPFDIYEEYADRLNQNKLASIYFIPLADYGPHDINLPFWSPKYRRLIQKLDESSTIGIHPGYVSNFYPEKLETEIQRLEEIVNHPVSKSRQHFLILKFPETYRELIKNNIKEDYTLGYSDHVGFRASCTRPFHFFDLEEDETKELLLTPFCVMDVTLNLYMSLNPDQAKDKLNELTQRVRECKGLFIPLWHNESLSEQFHWKEWKGVFTHMIEQLN